MSKGGGESQTTTAQIPEEFLSFIFGPGPGAGGARPSGGFQFPSLAGVPTGSLGLSFADQIGLNEGGQKLPSATGGVPATGGGSVTGAASGGGFGGVLPEAISLFDTGTLAPGPVFGETSQQGQQQRLDLASFLSGNVLPQAQETFTQLGDISRFGGIDPLEGFTPFADRSEQIADFATQQLQDQLERNVLPSLSQAAINAGQFGSSRQGIAEGIAQAESAKNIAGVRASILQQGAQISQEDARIVQSARALEQRTQEQQQQALFQQFAATPQLAQLLGLPAGIVSGVGAEQDVLEQGQQGTEFQNLLRLAQLIQGFIPGASQTTITEGGGPSALGGAAGGALTGASLGSIIPGLGTAVGGIGGGILGLLGFL